MVYFVNIVALQIRVIFDLVNVERGQSQFSTYKGIEFVKINLRFIELCFIYY